ncbi:Hypothetical protein FKW44_019318 [Caligus rogercresseyi]|uniref:Uncharacterized protein n=1 Tax=Caligus rogercresseyi TaxID=217165 RepID=A0A7T8GVP8_CALRO|nr:Hypothetical protein FKW44_019318 [Caligus rogercresseyi]
MTEQHNNWNKIAGVLIAGCNPTEIAFTLNVSRPSVYDVKNALVAGRDLE